MTHSQGCNRMSPWLFHLFPWAPALCSRGPFVYSIEIFSDAILDHTTFHKFWAPPTWILQDFRRSKMVTKKRQQGCRDPRNFGSHWPVEANSQKTKSHLNQVLVSMLANNLNNVKSQSTLLSWRRELHMERIWGTT